MNPFNKHPKEVGMNYFSHMGYAFTVAGRLSIALFAVIIHAFFPFILTTKASEIVKDLNNEFTNR